jgi:hypothetical protein
MLLIIVLFLITSLPPQPNSKPSASSKATFSKSRPTLPTESIPVSISLVQ